MKSANEIATECYKAFCVLLLDKHKVVVLKIAITRDFGRGLTILILVQGLVALQTLRHTVKQKSHIKEIESKVENGIQIHSFINFKLFAFVLIFVNIPQVKIL